MPRQSIFILIFVFLLTYPNGGNAAFKEKDRREACYELADVSKFFFCSLKNGGPRFMIYNPTPPPLNTTAWYLSWKWRRNRVITFDKKLEADNDGLEKSDS